MADDTACSWPAIIFNAPSFQLMVRRTWLRAGATVGSGCSSANGSGLWLSIKRKRDHFAMTATFQSSQISYTGNIQKPFKKCLFSNHQILELVGSSSKPAPCWTDAKTDPQEGTPPPSQEHLLGPELPSAADTGHTGQRSTSPVPSPNEGTWEWTHTGFWCLSTKIRM